MYDRVKVLYFFLLRLLSEVVIRTTANFDEVSAIGGGCLRLETGEIWMRDNNFCFAPRCCVSQLRDRPRENFFSLIEPPIVQTLLI
jgi:hypothetical protein